MNTYTPYHLDPAQFKFLSVFKDKWLEIKADYERFIQDSTVDFNLISEVMTPRSKTINTKKGGTYQGFGLLYHGKSFLQLIEDNHLSWPHYTNEQIKTALNAVFSKHFKATQACINEANRLSQNGIRNVYFSIFKPGLDIKCHINYNPHIYRGYLGLTVPKGDIAMKICGETLHWQEGEIMVLDHTFPHCPHNRTQESRVALIIDFYQPDKDRKTMVELENKLITERMQTNPYGFGVFGDDDFVSAEDLKKYGFEEQANWSNNLF